MGYNQHHYNAVSDAWQDIMGDNFHFGYFKTPDTPLSEGTNALIDRMISLAAVTRDTTILDVGCGIGASAFYLHEKFNCSVIGITTSERGMETANQLSEKKGYSGSVKFQLADGTDNGFPGNSFDIAWVLESSHLMNKDKLLKECHRVLRSKGVLLLCDIMRNDHIPLTSLFTLPKRVYNYRYIKSAFGSVSTAPPEYYRKALCQSGFHDITTINISDKVFPTMRNWKENAIKNKDKISEKISNAKIDDFIRACDILEPYYASGFLIYGIVRGVK
jgi:27-O-demethylrifamycin SV methyltransferase